ncbi:MAG: transposase [Bacteroidota bacterium]
MSKKTRTKKVSYPRERRYFSESFRKARVAEYESGEVSVAEISRTYGVDKSAVYKWIKKYSLHYQKQIVKVVEPKSETKRRQALEQKVKELEQLIGQKEVELVYLRKLIELAQFHYGLDFEKNFATPSSQSSTKTQEGQ